MYICGMSKTIKIPDSVHTELKTFVAISKESIESFAGYAIMAHLKERGHHFVLGTKANNTKNLKHKQSIS